MNQLSNESIVICLVQRRFKIETFSISAYYHPEFFDSAEHIDMLFRGRVANEVMRPFVEKGINPQTKSPFSEDVMVLGHESAFHSYHETWEGHAVTKKCFVVRIVLLSPSFPPNACISSHGEDPRQVEVNMGVGRAPLMIAVTTHGVKREE